MEKRTRFFSLLAAWILLLTFLPALSAAEKKIVKPLPATFDPANMGDGNAYGRITAYNSEDCSITVEFCDEEGYARDDIFSLKPGDVIISQGREIEVQDIELLDGDEDYITMAWINDKADVPYEDSFWMLSWSTNDFHHLKEERIVMMYLEPVRISLYDLQVYLDDYEPDPDTHLPSVYSPEEFLAMLAENSTADGSEFMSGMFWFNFDGGECPVSIWRKNNE